MGMNRFHYRPTITTRDLWPDVDVNVGSDRHVALIDKLDVIANVGEEELILLYEQTKDYEDVGRVLGVTPEAVQQAIRRILARNRCPRGGCCRAN